MQFIKLIRVATALLFAAALTSCNIGSTPEPVQDVNAIYTSVAGTMVSQFTDQQTQTAQAVPPSPAASLTALDTFTPLPTNPITPSETPLSFNTPVAPILTAIPSVGGTPGSMRVGCLNAAYVSESGPGYATKFSPLVNFTKSWTLMNTGDCPWLSGYALAFDDGDRMNGKSDVVSTYIGFVAVGKTHTFTVFLQAPRAAGHYRGIWQMITPSNVEFGDQVAVDIVVGK